MFQFNYAVNHETKFSEREQTMHSFARHQHNKPRDASGKPTKGLILNDGWRYDVIGWFCDTFLFQGKLRELRYKTADLAHLQPGDQVLDVGCGTGTLALEVQRRLGATGHVVGIDPGEQQIARARYKAARRNMPIDFQIGVIEHLPFPDQTFDVALSTIMMHHLGDGLKRQGLSEIARVLKPGGRLVIADFNRPEQPQSKPAQFGSVRDLPAFVKEAGFSQVSTDEMPFPRFSGGVGFVRAVKE
jgi:ubiquinone/menaquinone biosynthesis C-methylase UbiE